MMADYTEYFEFLDGVRESGVTNMFGAGAYLEEDMGLSKTEARKVLMAWMQTFNEDQTAAERAQLVT